MTYITLTVSQLLRSVSQPVSVRTEREENEQNILLRLSEEWHLGWYLCIRLAQSEKLDKIINISDVQLPLMTEPELPRDVRREVLQPAAAQSRLLTAGRPPACEITRTNFPRAVRGRETPVEFCVLSLRQTVLVRLFTFCSVCQLFYCRLSTSLNFIFLGLELPSGGTNQAAVL